MQTLLPTVSFQLMSFLEVLWYLHMKRSPASALLVLCGSADKFGGHWPTGQELVRIGAWKFCSIEAKSRCAMCVFPVSGWPAIALVSSCSSVCPEPGCCGALSFCLLYIWDIEDVLRSDAEEPNSREVSV